MADTYSITNQRQTTAVVGNQFVPVMEVTFQTVRGEVGSVTLPLAQYSKDAVNTAIVARVAAMDDVASL